MGQVLKKKNIFAEVVPDMSGYVPTRKAALKASAHIKDALEKHVPDKEKESKKLRSPSPIIDENNISEEAVSDISRYVAPRKAALKASVHIKYALEKHIPDKE